MPLISNTKKICVLLFLSLATFAVKASMVWVAIAVKPEELKQLEFNEKQLMQRMLQPNAKDSLSLDKAWHGIHYLLNGKDWTPKTTEGYAIMGGRGFGPELGYGKPRLLLSNEVKAISSALTNISIKTLSDRYDPSDMETAQIYPSIWQQEGQDALKYLLNFYLSLREFYKRAAEQDLAIVIVIF